MDNILGKCAHAQLNMFSLRIIRKVFEFYWFIKFNGERRRLNMTMMNFSSGWMWCSQSSTLLFIWNCPVWHYKATSIYFLSLRCSFKWPILRSSSKSWNIFNNNNKNNVYEDQASLFVIMNNPNGIFFNQLLLLQ
jgi:hypothetical protein